MNRSTERTIRELNRAVVHMLMRQAEEQSRYRLDHVRAFGREPMMHNLSAMTSNRVALGLPIVWC